MSMNFSFSIIGKKIAGVQLARLTFAIIFVCLPLLFIYSPDSFEGVSSMVLALATLTYAWLTYELLRLTSESKSRAYIDLQFIVVGDLNEKFMNEYGKYITSSEQFSRLWKERDASKTSSTDIIFIKVQNIGNEHALDVTATSKFEAHGLGETQEVAKPNSFSNLEKGEIAVGILHVFENTSSNDHVRLLKSEVSYTDVNSKQVGLKPTVLDYSKTAKWNNFDDKINIVIKAS